VRGQSACFVCGIRCVGVVRGQSASLQLSVKHINFPVQQINQTQQIKLQPSTSSSSSSELVPLSHKTVQPFNI